MFSFLDLEFEPADVSVFDNTIDSPFNIVVHWRKPSDFMRADFAEGLLEP